MSGLSCAIPYKTMKAERRLERIPRIDLFGYRIPRKKGGKSMRIQYELVEERHEDPEMGSYISYGIALKEEENIIRTIADVFLDKGKAEEFIGRCNEFKLSPIHLEEVIEDALV